MSGNVVVAEKTDYSGSTGHRNNFTGRAGADGFLGTMGGKQATWESDGFARQHTPYPGSGSFGVTHMRPCNSKGNNLTKEEEKNYRITYGGRKYPLGANGEISFCDTAAFLPAVKDRLEMENYLSKLSTWIMGGNDVFEQIFPGILQYCTPSDGKTPVRGHNIPVSLAKEDCTPSLLRLYDPSMEVFLRGLAKLRAIIETYPTVFLGDLPSWDMSYKDAGVKNDIVENTDIAELPAPGK